MLKELLNLTQEHEDYKLVPANLMGGNGSTWGSKLTVGKGSHAGIEVGMVALTEFGQVVGLVTEVGENWATVTTILDSSLQVSATLSSSGYNGIVQGAYQRDGSDRLRMDYLATDAVIRNNDQVVTTGSTLYPRGLILELMLSMPVWMAPGSPNMRSSTRPQSWTLSSRSLLSRKYVNE